MKRLTFFLFLFLNYSNLSSQDYVPMAVDSATWLLASTHEVPQFSEFAVLRIEGDTIINDISYSKIYHYDYQIEISLNSRKLFGLIRDNVNERKVYGGIINEMQNGFETFLNPNAQCDWGDGNSFNEHLLYNFNVIIGDTINSCMISNQAVITEIDTIDRQGFQRRNLRLDDNFTIMTEGIGTCIGIFKGKECYFTGWGSSYALVKYCVGSFANCSLLTSAKEIHLLDQIEVSPNPVSNNLNISGLSTKCKLSLFDIRGKFIDSFINLNLIDMSIYNPGLYILMIWDESGKIYTEKVIKN